MPCADWKSWLKGQARTKARVGCYMNGKTAMEEDEIMTELRRIREEHAAQFDYDIHAMCEDLRRQEKESSRKFVSPRKKKPDTKAAAKQRRAS
jgi:hypothetical protein